MPRAAGGDTVTEIRLRDGSVITAPPENVLWTQFSDVWYHSAYTKYSRIPPRSLVVDIGANVGVFSLLAARTARIVYSLEPAPANFSRLVSNTSRARNIVPLNMACGKVNGSAPLDLSIDAVSFSLVTHFSEKHETVKVVTLGTLFDLYKIEQCDFLKLDCEGSEFDIILQSEPSLLRRVSRIAMEYHDHLSEQFSHRDILQQLKDLGFRTHVYGQHDQTYGMISAVRL